MPQVACCRLWNQCYPIASAADGPTAALGRQQLFATVRMLSRMVQNLKTRVPRKQPG